MYVNSQIHFSGRFGKTIP